MHVKTEMAINDKKEPKSAVLFTVYVIHMIRSLVSEKNTKAPKRSRVSQGHKPSCETVKHSVLVIDKFKRHGQK